MVPVAHIQRLVELPACLATIGAAQLNEELVHQEDQHRDAEDQEHWKPVVVPNAVVSKEQETDYEERDQSPKDDKTTDDLKEIHAFLPLSVAQKNSYFKGFVKHVFPVSKNP